MSGLRADIQSVWPSLSQEAVERVLRFYSVLVQENEVQNLTRLISEPDFLEGHLLDVKALLDSGLLEYPAMDLGSGGGVPGLLAGLIDSKLWILTDSEGRKADFLSRAVQELGATQNIRVFKGRGEEALKETRVSSVVARAVGPVDRIYPWIRSCSTWNTLILLKGPGWEEEWNRFQASKWRRELSIQGEFRYSAGTKSRVIIRLSRNVPRRTSTHAAPR